jgi:hypothetical protein
LQEPAATIRHLIIPPALEIPVLRVIPVEVTAAEAVEAMAEVEAAINDAPPPTRIGVLSHCHAGF